MPTRPRVSSGPSARKSGSTRAHGGSSSATSTWIRPWRRWMPVAGSSASSSKTGVERSVHTVSGSSGPAPLIPSMAPAATDVVSSTARSVSTRTR